MSERDRECLFISVPVVEYLVVFFGSELEWEWSWGGWETILFLIIDVAREQEQYSFEWERCLVELFFVVGYLNVKKK